MKSKRIGVVSYNIYANFTNYGSALQSWALFTVLRKIGFDAYLVDYCPDILKDKDPLNPLKNTWDQNSKIAKMIDDTMPAIKINYKKFMDFYYGRFNVTSKYTSDNFNCIKAEIDHFVCGSDTIFCVNEFGVDDGYYANFDCMKQNAISYAASFGDSHFSEEDLSKLNTRFNNFLALGIRENKFIPFVKEKTNVPVQQVIDPTLLLLTDDYLPLIKNSKENQPYILYYSRRYNKKMDEYVDLLAKKYNANVVEISLNAGNAKKGHKMRYDAGVEEFLGLVKDCMYMVTNSYHGMIFAMHFKKEFVVFSREQCDNKIEELMTMFGVRDRLLITGNEKFSDKIDYDSLYKIKDKKRKESLKFLQESLEKLVNVS